MTWLLLTLLLSIDPFWQTKPPPEWNDLELSQLLSDSPWAQMATQPGKARVGKNADQSQLVQVYLATAGPIVKATAERERRADLRHPGLAKALADDPLSEERSVWFAENRKDYVIVAVRIEDRDAFSSEAETRRMEQDCTMELDHRAVKVSAYFPPAPSDSHLYLAFPRESSPHEASGNLSFELYVPGVHVPYRTVTFKLKDMSVDGKLEM